MCGKTEILYCNNGYTTLDAIGWLLSSKNCDKNSAGQGMRAFEGVEGLFSGWLCPANAVCRGADGLLEDLNGIFGILDTLR